MKKRSMSLLALLLAFSMAISPLSYIKAYAAEPEQTAESSVSSETEETAEQESAAVESAAESSEAENDRLVNINSANLEELKKISGVGDVKAQSIIEYREKNGGFKSIDEIKNIDGIGEKTFEKIKDKITL